MGREIYERRKSEFIETIIKEKKLPKVWEFHFSDGEDMGLWYNQISKFNQFQDFINEVNELLKNLDIKTLNDKEREEEFLVYIKKLKRVPVKNEIYFSDNIDMYTWYIKYRINNKKFETIVHNNLPEYQELDLAEIWSLVKQEFITILKKLKRVPNHGEVILQNGIDVRTIYDKLETYDPVFFEKLLLHLQTYNKKGLSIDDRVKELKEAVSELGYIPDLQESRFSDGTDMFIWYMNYKSKLPNLEIELNSLIHKPKPSKKVNIYLIPKFKNDTGKFYTIRTNVGERLDLSNIHSLEKLDSSLEERGEFFLQPDEEMETVSIVKGKSR